MYTAIIKNSIIFKAIAYLLNEIVLGYRNSFIAKCIKSYRYSSLAKAVSMMKVIWVNSLPFKVLSCFVNPDVDWSKSFFYRLAALLVKRPIVFFSDLFGDGLCSAVNNSWCIRAWKNSKDIFLAHVFYYIALAVFVLSNIYMLLLLSRGSEKIGIIICGLVWLLSLFVTLLIRNITTSDIFKNSIAYTWIKNLIMEYWSDSE